jgi:hypothetical protein
MLMFLAMGGLGVCLFNLMEDTKET